MEESGSNQPIHFGPFEFHEATQELFNQSARLRLSPQAFQVLRLLLQKPGHLIKREEFHQALWPADTFVDFDHGLNNAIKRIRDVLNDSAESPVYIETLPRLGYRFIGQIQPDPQSATASPKQAQPAEAASVPTGVNTRSFLPSGGRAKILALAALVVATFLVVIPLSNVRGRLSGHSGLFSTRIQSLAVLPLANLSGDPEQEYFADGLTEELTTELGRISALRVLSRTSVMQYKGTKKPLHQIARELNVDALLEGTVVRTGSHVHITAHLIQASPEGHLWGDTYDTDAGDVLTVQQRVADSVAREIRVALAPRDAASSRGSRSVNPVAQDLYFRGIHAIRSGGGGATRSAVDFFQQAIDKDPNFARAYSGLAKAYAVWYPDDARPRENMPKSREAALKAVALDDSLASAHVELGYVELSYDWNWTEAEKEFKRALELDPSYAIARHYYARELVVLGRAEEALAQVARALELEPYSGLDYPAWVLYLAHRYDDALQLAQKMVAMNSNFSWGRWALAANYEQLGKPKKAAEEYLKFEILSGANPQRIKRLQDGFARSGVKGFWQASLDDYQEISKSRYVPPVLVAGTCIRLGDKAGALAWLERGFEERDDLMIDLNVDPIFLDLHSDPRFQNLLRRVGLGQ